MKRRGRFDILIFHFSEDIVIFHFSEDILIFHFSEDFLIFHFSFLRRHSHHIFLPSHIYHKSQWRFDMLTSSVCVPNVFDRLEQTWHTHIIPLLPQNIYRFCSLHKTDFFVTKLCLTDRESCQTVTKLWPKLSQFLTIFGQKTVCLTDSLERAGWLAVERVLPLCVCGRHGGTPPTAQLTQLVCLHTLNSKLVNTGAHWTTLDSTIRCNCHCVCVAGTPPTADFRHNWSTHTQ